jgi:hypothetical protein
VDCAGDDPVAVTAAISTDVAAVSLFWVLPLALYLLTFVAIFRDRPWVAQGTVLMLAPFAAVAMVETAFWLGHYWGTAFFLHLAGFTVLALACHSELNRGRPTPARLTEFYLWTSFGGVISGALAGLIASHVFNGVAEYHPPGRAARDAWRIRRGSAAVSVSSWRCCALSRFAASSASIGLPRPPSRRIGSSCTAPPCTGPSVREAGGTPVTGPPEPRSYYYFGGPIGEAIAAARAAHGRLIGIAAVGWGNRQPCVPPEDEFAGWDANRCTLPVS